MKSLAVIVIIVVTALFAITVRQAYLLHQDIKTLAADVHQLSIESDQLKAQADLNLKLAKALAAP